MVFRQCAASILDPVQGTCSVLSFHCWRIKIRCRDWTTQEILNRDWWDKMRTLCAMFRKQCPIFMGAYANVREGCSTLESFLFNCTGIQHRNWTKIS